MTDHLPVCLKCDRNSDEVPLLRLEYQGSEAWICPQHLPILIHKPAQLAGRLPGAERLSPSLEGSRALSRLN
jgi:hypothetical protein